LAARRIWLPTLRACGFRARAQYNIRDTFITLALSAGEDPGWVADVCGTSEQMIFGHALAAEHEVSRRFELVAIACGCPR
jgi:hypothetical protein